MDRLVERVRDLRPAVWSAWQAAFWTRFEADPGWAWIGKDGGVLLGGGNGHRIVEFAAGEGWPDVLVDLQADPAIAAVTVPLDVWPGSIAGSIGNLGPPAPGFKFVARWTHAYDLHFAPQLVGTPPSGYALTDWEPASFQAAARLLTDINGPRVDGVFLTHPHMPTESACLELIGRILGSAAFSPDASALAWHGDRLVGLSLVTHPAGVEAMLYEIAVRLRHRGSGLAPYLLDRLKVVSREAGKTHVRFLSCAGNRAVQGLFQAEHGTSEIVDRGWIWLRSDTLE